MNYSRFNRLKEICLNNGYYFSSYHVSCCVRDSGNCVVVPYSIKEIIDLTEEEFDRFVFDLELLLTFGK